MTEAAGEHLDWPTPSRRRSGQRRRLLAATASRHIIERGFEEFSVNTLAEDVGMVMAREDIYGSLRGQLAEITIGERPLPSKLAAAIRLYMRTCLNHQDQILLMYREYRDLPGDAQHRYMDREKAIAGVFTDVISASVRRGIFNPGQRQPSSPMTSSCSATCRSQGVGTARRDQRRRSGAPAHRADHDPG